MIIYYFEKKKLKTKHLTFYVPQTIVLYKIARKLMGQIHYFERPAPPRLC